MSTEKSTVRLSLLGKDYQIACPTDEKQALIEAGDYLDEQMRALRDGGKVIGTERIAVMAALNIAHQYLAQKTGFSAADEESSYAIDEALRKLNNKTDQALQRLKQLEI